MREFAGRPSVGIVVPAFNEADNLSALVQRLSEVLGSGFDWHVLVVDDGSTDATRETLQRLHRQDARVRAIHLLMNSGHMRALAAGLDHTDADVVVTMDADLQHPPELIPSLIEKWREGAQIVQTVRADSDAESGFKRLTSRFYYWLFRSITRIPIEPGMADFRALDRGVVRIVRQFREDNLPLRFLLARFPFRTVVVSYRPAPRFSGRTKYTLGRMLRFASESLFSFSLAPLYVGYLIGLVFLGLFALYSIYVLYARIVLHETIQGWTSQILVTLVSSAVEFLLIGILGGYIGAIHREVQRRPRYLVDERLGVPEPAANAAELLAP